MYWVALDRDGEFMNYHKSFESACIEVMISEPKCGYVVTEEAFNFIEEGEGCNGVKVYPNGKIEDAEVYDIKLLHILANMPDDGLNFNTVTELINYYQEDYK